jgi:hypothetical protein
MQREPFDLGIARHAATSFFNQLNSVQTPGAGETEA